MVARSVEIQLEQIIRTLCKRERASPETRAMRMFQFQTWLLTRGSDDLEILNAAREIYAGISVAESVTRKLRQPVDGKKLTASSALKNLISEDLTFCKLLDVYFASRRDLAFLHSDFTRRISAEESKIIGSVNFFTELCLRLSYSGHVHFKRAAMQLYSYAAVSDVDLFKDVQKHRTERRSRQSFLFVAWRLGAPFFESPVDSASLYSFLHKESDKHRSFRRFFAMCADVQNRLAHGAQLSGELIAEWAGEQPLSLNSIEPIDEAEIKAAQSFDELRERKSSGHKLPSEIIRSW